MIDITILSFSIATTRIIVASVIGTIILILSLVVIIAVATFFIERQRHKGFHIDTIINLDDIDTGGDISNNNSKNW